MTTQTAISLPCPNGCNRTVAAEGREVHYCVIKEFGETYREYIGTVDGEIITRGDSNHQVETAINDYILNLIQQGLIDQPLAALADPPTDTPPSGPPVDDGEQDNWGGFRCRNCDGAHHIQRCPEIWRAMRAPERADSSVRTHLSYGHLRRDLFAPVLFCACGAQATIVVYGDPDVCLCGHCHAVSLNDAPRNPDYQDGCGLIVAGAAAVTALVLTALLRN